VRAVIMAGGRGSRLAPLTTVLPKPLMPLGDRPILDVLIRQLMAAGVERITICVAQTSALIESWVKHQPAYAVPIDFVYEDEPLGTAGALGTIDRPEEIFLALNGDVLTTVDFNALRNHTASSQALVTMGVHERTIDIAYGVVHAREDGSVVRLEEKPSIHYTVSMGVYAMRPEICDLIESDERIDFPDLLGRALAAGSVVQTLLHDGYWRDIGNRDDYEAAIADFDADASRFLPS
jgi:NDP-sugar pyrophosphorylase family protein